MLVLIRFSVLRKLLTALVLACLFFTWIPTVYGAPGINKKLSYQAKITASNGINIANGNYNMQFAFFTVSTGGSAAYTETWNSGTSQVSLADGIFSVDIGTHTSLPGSLDFNTDNLYLEVRLDADNNGSYEEVFLPRKRMTAAPYAFNSDMLDGKSEEEFADTSESETITGSYTFQANTSVTVNTSSGSAIVINQQGTGGILDVQDNGTSALRVLDGGLIRTGSGGTANNADGAGDLYVQNDLEVDGTIYGTISGTLNPGFTTGSVAFQGASGLTQDNTNLFWDDTNNRLGIGTASPQQKLHVYGSAAGSYIAGRIENTGLNGAADFDFINDARQWKIGVNANDDFRIQDTTGGSINVFVIEDGASVNSLYVNSSGNVGVGTSTPTTFKLQVAGSVGPNADDSYDLGSSSLRWRDLYLGPSSLHIYSTAAETTTARDWKFGIQETNGSSEGNLRILEGSNELLNITPAGNIGIGDTTPASLFTVGNGDLFQVNSSGAIASVQGVTNTGSLTTSGGAVSLNASSNFATNINTGTSTGAVSIGNASNALTLGGVIQGASPLVFEGVTDDTYETTFAITDTTTADKTITFQDNTGVVPLSTAGNTLFFTTSGATSITLPTSGTMATGTGTNGYVAYWNGTNSLTSEQYLSVTRGGTGTGTQFTTGSLVFAGGSGVYSQDNTNLFWDDTNNRLGIGTASPSDSLHLYKASGNIGAKIETDSNGYATFYLDGAKTVNGTIGAFGFLNSGDSVAQVYSSRDGADDAGSITFQTQPTGGSMTDRLSITSAGSVGIGDTTPTSLFTVGNGDLFQVNSSGAIATVQGITNTGAVTSSGGAVSLNASSNFATNINTGTSTGAVSIGGNSNTLAINTSSWDVSSAGVASGLTGLTVTGTTTASGAVISLNASSNFATNINTGTSTGTVTIGNASANVAITDGQWSVSGAGVASFVGVNSTTGLIQGTGGLIVSGAASSINASSNFATNINTGTSTGAVSIGGGLNTLAINTSSWDVSSVGVASGLTGLTSSGNILFSSLSAESGVYTDSSGYLTTTPPLAGTLGYWTRSGTTLSPSITDDTISISSSDVTNPLLSLTSLDLQTDASSSVSHNVTMSPSDVATLYGYKLNISNNPQNEDYSDTVYGMHINIDDDFGGYRNTITGLYVDTDTTNSRDTTYSAVFNGGNVGVGDSSPDSLFTVGNGDLFQVNSSGAIVSVQGITNTGSFVTSGNTVYINHGSNFATNINTGTSTGTVTIGNASANVAITDGQWSVSGAGAASFVGVNSTTGLIQGTGGLTVSGATSSINASSNFATNINTGTSTGAVSIGNASNALTLAGIIQGASPLIFEGATDNTYETTFAITDPTVSDKTITFQDNTGVVPLSTAGNTLFFTTSGATSITLPTSGTVATGTGTNGYVAYWNGTNSLTSEQYLSVTRGGTGTGTQFTSGSLVFAGGSGVYTQDNSNLFWDDTNNRLGIGTSTPSSSLTILSQNDVSDIMESLRIERINYDNVGDIGLGSSIGFYLENDQESIIQAGSIDLVLEDPRESGEDSSVRFNITVDSSITEAMRIDSGGYVGIGDSSPQSLFTVGNGDLFQVNSSGNLVKVNNVAYSWPASQGASNTYLRNDGSGNLTWVTAPGTGDITTVGSMTSGDAFSDVNADDDWLGLGSIAGRIAFDDQATDYVNILSANVGIGDTTPDQLLEIMSSGAANTQFTISNTNAGSYDSQIGFELADGTNTFTMGIDDSDSDKFKISTTALGTNDRFVIDSTGNIGIGTSSPSSILHLSKANTTATVLDTLNINVTRSSAGNAGLGSGVVTYLEDNDGMMLEAGSIDTVWEAVGVNSGVASMRFNVRDTGGMMEAMRVDNAGYVGIGDSSPASLFTVGNGDLFQVNSSGYAYHPLGAVGTPSISFVGDTNTGIYSSGADTFDLTTAGTRRLSVTSGGFVGVGAFSNPSYPPSSLLDIEQMGTDGGLTDFIEITNTRQASSNTQTGVLFNQWFSGTVDDPGVDGSARIVVGTEGAWNDTASTRDSYFSLHTSLNGDLYERMRINSSGYIGIGDTSPDAMLDVASSSAINTNIFVVNTNAGDYDTAIGFQLAEGTNTFTMGVDDSDSDKFKISTTALGTNDRFVIDSSGNIGLGFATPSANLHLYENSTETTTSMLLLQQAGTGDPFIGFVADTSSSNVSYAMGIDSSVSDSFILSAYESASPSLGQYDFLKWTSGALYLNTSSYDDNSSLTMNQNGAYFLTNSNPYNSYLGIGDSTPDSELDILSSADLNTQITITNTNVGNYDTQIGFQLAEGTNTFTMGVDDSDNDSFKISTTALGTNDRLIINSSGVVRVVNDSEVGGNLNVSGETQLNDYTEVNASFYTSGTVGFSGLSSSGTAGTAIHINGSNQLFKYTSSRRYKKSITDIETDTSRIFDLRPVSYTPNELPDLPENRTFGLIAEETAEVLPQLVFFDNQGRPDSVHYEILSVLLLKEMQKTKTNIMDPLMSGTLALTLPKISSDGGVIQSDGLGNITTGTIKTNSFSSDNGLITSNGLGTLSVNNLAVTSGITGGVISVGSFSSDGGSISSNGSGTLTAKNIIATDSVSVGSGLKDSYTNSAIPFADEKNSALSEKFESRSIIGAINELKEDPVFDLARYYNISDESINDGVIVSTDLNNHEFILKSSGPSDKNMIGVISTYQNTPSSENNKLVVLVGQSFVKIDTENSDNIVPGDYLTSSSNNSGYAVKASGQGFVIGKAMGYWNKEDVNQDSSVVVFVQPQYWLGVTKTNELYGFDLVLDDIGAQETEASIQTQPSAGDIQGVYIDPNNIQPDSNSNVENTVENVNPQYNKWSLGDGLQIDTAILSITGALVVKEKVVFEKNLVVKGDVEVQGKLVVKDGVTFEKNLELKGSLSVVSKDVAGSVRFSYNQTKQHIAFESKKTNEVLVSLTPKFEDPDTARLWKGRVWVSSQNEEGFDIEMSEPVCDVASEPECARFVDVTWLAFEVGTNQINRDMINPNTPVYIDNPAQPSDSLEDVLETTEPIQQETVTSPAVVNQEQTSTPTSSQTETSVSTSETSSDISMSGE